ncbi:MAG: transglutaminase-like domain-containing protein [Gemmataceae bacterium]
MIRRVRLPLLVFAGLAWVGLLLAEEKPAEKTLTQWAKESVSRVAYGIYIKGKKVGWAIEETKVGEQDGKPVLISISESYMQTLFDGEKSVKKDLQTLTYSLEGRGELLCARVAKEDDGKTLTREAKRDAKGLLITTTQGGRTSTRRVPLPKDHLASHRALELWLSSPRKPGDSFVKYTLNWDETDIDQKETYTYKGSEDLALGGVPTTLHRVEILSDGAVMPATIFSDAKIYLAEVGGLLAIKLEPEKLAKSLNDKQLVDLMTAASIVLDKDLGFFGRLVDSLKLELSELGEFRIPASHRQIVTPGEKGTTIVEIKRDFKRDKPQPLTEEQRREFLAATPRIQCDEKPVQDKVKEILGDTTDPTQKAQKLANWVFKTLKKSYADNADTALEILDRKAGDCTEHTLLYVSLCRAAGLPAREVGGLAYVRASKPLLGWHAWAEIHDGHQWVSVDPTWDQYLVDGTHLKLSEGSQDSAWTNIAGKLKVKVLDFKRRSKG